MSSNQEPESSSSSYQQIPNISQAIFFIVIGLLIGCIIRELHKTRLKLPYTPTLMALGLLIGGLNGHMSLFGSSVRLLTNIDPEGILLVFLPILIFESSFNSDWHVFKRSFYQIILLAIPGVVICFALEAVTLKVILGYDDSELPWSGALTLGAIAAATDPVAVVALLKELGANHYFSTIVEGESLLNDGSAMVFFAIFYQLAGGGAPTVGYSIGQFFLISSGGVGIGLGIGILANAWLKRISKDSVLSITIIIIACYLTFFIAGSLPVSFSAVLALCTLGFFLSARSKTLISHKIEHPLHSVIQWTQFVAETLIFLLTGCIIGVRLLADPESTIVLGDWFKAIGFYFATNIIRAIVIFCLLPLLQKGVYKFNWKEYIVMSYAGLRGSLGLVLGLIVFENPVFQTPENKRMGQLILFYIATLATLTLLINGTTTGFIVSKTGMIKFNSIRKRLLYTLVNDLHLSSAETFYKLREENPSALCDWDQVRNVTGLNDEFLRTNLRNQMEVLPTRQTEEQQQLIIEARHRYLQNFLRILWEKFEKSQISGEAANLLHKSTKVANDQIENKFQIFDFLYSYFVRARSLKIYTHLAKIPLIGFVFKQMITDHLLFIVDVIIGLVDIVEELRDRLENFPMSQIVMGELESNVNDAKTYLNGVESQFVDLISFVSTKRFTKIIFGEQINIIEEKYDRGELEDKEYETLTEMIHKRIQNFEKITKMKFNPPTFTSLITSFPMFTLLTDAEKRHLIQNSETRNVKQGFKLCEKGSESDDVYFILKGEAESLIGTFTTRKGVGSIISFANLIHDDNISLITSQTTEKVRAQVIRRSALKKIMTQNTEFRDMVIKEGGVVLRHLIEAETTSVGSKLKELIRESEVRYFVEGDKVSLKEGGFLLKGTLKAGDIVYSDYKILPHTIGVFKAETDGLLLSFNNVQDNRRQSSLIFSFDARA